jgi:hypothetical protein
MKTPTKKPGSPLDAIYRRTDLTPEQVFQALSRLRQEAQNQIEYLIQLVDEMDGDTDLEPEPVEGNLATVGSDNLQVWFEAHDDAEQDDCELEDGRDDEWSLGSINPKISGSQQDWTRGAEGDVELEHDGREPSEEDEGGQCDDEGAEPDAGIGDFDGLMEQCQGYSGSGASEFARFVA